MAKAAARSAISGRRAGADRRRKGNEIRDHFPLRRLSIAEPIPDWVWREPDMVEALAVRNIAFLFARLQRLGMSQRRIGARTGQSQSEVSEVLAGRRITTYDVLLRLANGLGIPCGYLGLAYHSPTDVPASTAVVDVWTGHEIRLLRQALRMSVRQFAAHLGVSGRAVCKWEAGDRSMTPGPRNQAVLDSALGVADDVSRRRFAMRHAIAVPPRVGPPP